MVRRVSLPYAVVVISLSACGVSRPLQPAGDEWPREATVSARHVIPARAQDVADLRLRAQDEEVLLTWTEGQHPRFATSKDGGRTLASFTSPAKTQNVAATVDRELAVSHAGEHTWLITPGAHVSDEVAWTASIPTASDRPIAIEELCGLVAVVAIDRSRTDHTLMLRRYLPPRRRGPQNAQLIGSPIDIGGTQPRGNTLTATALVESALLAWVDSNAVRLVRVELPDVLCAGVASRS